MTPTPTSTLVHWWPTLTPSTLRESPMLNRDYGLATEDATLLRDAGNLTAEAWHPLRRWMDARADSQPITDRECRRRLNQLQFFVA